ncbi:MAG: DUF2723 domain-containing protein [Bacteroidota bacterium]
MFSNHQSINRNLALFTFFSSLVVYVLTIAPTASFWDAGEFIAVAHGLQVNHPPGAPFYSILGRIFSMFMPVEYVALSINFISALASALTVMLLYLIIVRLVKEFKGNPNELPLIDKIGMYGGAIVGALTFAVTDTFWFNAVEAEVYALSMFFTAIVVWLALKWSDQHDEPYNERWLVLIAYMFGLAIGVHLLNLLAIFFVALIVYFKKRDFELMSFLIMGLLAVASFFVIYPATIQWLPGWMDSIGDASYGLIGPVLFIVLFVGAIIYGIYYTQKNKHRLSNIALISYLMILIGYSSYSVIMIRSIANPPIDENDPETIEAFVKYLKREQYGDTPILKGNNFNPATGQIDRNSEKLFPRRHSPVATHLRYYANYDSDLEFFLDYQVNHMYIRYFNWNFVGREADIQDTGWQSGFTGNSPYANNPANNSYFYIPFLLGIAGMIFHFSKDWRRAFAVLALFIVTGLAIIIFLNQPPFQPRERDYAYVGSFFAFAIWIGFGGTALVEYLKAYTKSNTAVGYAVIGLLLLASPVWMASQNWDDHDRSGRYIAPDYAKNLLESVGPNGIVFTNGDNDTFPLWYAQEVEGIRTDVRIVCLSLLNTDWYIRQMRDQWSHESAPLPITLSDEEIEQLTAGYSRWEPRQMNIPVNKELLRTAFAEDGTYKEAIGVSNSDIPILQTGTSYGIPVDSLDDMVSWQLNGRLFGQDGQGNNVHYLQTQDQMILHILENNNWLRPVYFANTVSNQSQLNLHDYMRTEGKAYRVVPKDLENPSGFGGVIADAELHRQTFNKFSFQNWNDPDAYYDENIRRMLGNYRYNFLQLAEQYQELGQIDSAASMLSWGEEKVPFDDIDNNVSVRLIYATRYAQLERPEDASRLADGSYDIMVEQFKSALASFLDTQTAYEEANADFDEARRTGNVKKQREARQRQVVISNKIERVVQDLQRARQTVVLALNVYYQSGSIDRAQELTGFVNDTLSGIDYPGLNLPQDETSTSLEIQRYGL